MVCLNETPKMAREMVIVWRKMMFLTTINDVFQAILLAMMVPNDTSPSPYHDGLVHHD